MTRRASLPGADELFRANTPALSAVRQVVEEAQEVAKPIGVSATPKSKKGVRSSAIDSARRSWSCSRSRPYCA